MMVLISFLAMNIMTKIQNQLKNSKTHLVCEFVILTTSSSPGEGGAGEEPRSPQDFVLVTWETIGKCRLRRVGVNILSSSVRENYLFPSQVEELASHPLLPMLLFSTFSKGFQQQPNLLKAGWMMREFHEIPVIVYWQAS